MIQILWNWFLNGGWLLVLIAAIGIGFVIFILSGFKNAKVMPDNFTNKSPGELFYDMDEHSPEAVFREDKPRPRFKDYSDVDEGDLTFMNQIY